MDEKLIGTELQKFNITDAAIGALSQEFMSLTIKGLDDREGYKQVHDARMVIKKKRVEVTKTGKDLREDALKYQKAILGEEKRILALLAPIEDHLTEEEERIDREKKRIEEEIEEKERARIQVRIDFLFDSGCRLKNGIYSIFDLEIPDADLRVYTDEQFESICNKVKDLVKAENDRLAEEERKRKEENDRLAGIAAEQEAERKRIVEKQAAILFEQKKIEDEKREIEKGKLDLEHQKELERVRKETEEQVKAKAEAQAKKDAEEKAERSRLDKLAEEAEAKHKEEIKPDKEKILKLTRILEEIEFPTMKTEEGEKVLTDSKTKILNVVKIMKKWAETL